jgi:hypothetical protein
MADMYTRKASFAKVIEDPKAVEFHASKYLAGSRYPLALQCYQHLMLMQIKQGVNNVTL